MTTKPDLRLASDARLTSQPFQPISVLSTLFQFAAAFTPYNVGSVLWRLFSTLETVQYIGGIASVLWRLLSTVGDNICTVGITSVLSRVFSTVD